MNRKTILLVSVFVVGAAIGGGYVVWDATRCLDYPGQTSWDLAIGVYETRTAENGSFRFHGDVTIAGSTGRPRAVGVHVEFVGQNNTTLRAVDLGDFGVDAQDHRNVSVWLRQTPERIRLTAERIESADNAEWFIGGLVRGEDNQYREYIVRRSPEDPSACQQAIISGR